MEGHLLALGIPSLNSGIKNSEFGKQIFTKTAFSNSTLVNASRVGELPNVESVPKMSNRKKRALAKEKLSKTAFRENEEQSNFGGEGDKMEGILTHFPSLSLNKQQTSHGKYGVLLPPDSDEMRKISAKSNDFSEMKFHLLDRKPHSAAAKKVKEDLNFGLNLSGCGISDSSKKNSGGQSVTIPRPESPASRSGCEPDSETVVFRMKPKRERAKPAFRTQKDAKFMFEPYATPEKIHNGLTNGIFEKGVLVVSPKSPDQAYIRIPGKENDDVNVSGIEARNRAFNGDVVVVEILPRASWKVRSERIEEVQTALGIDELSNCTSKKAIQGLIQENRIKNEPNFSEEISSVVAQPTIRNKKVVVSHNQGQKWMDILKDSIGIDAAPDQWLQKTGKIVSVVDAKGTRQLVGTLNKIDCDHNNPNRVIFTVEPIDCRMPKVSIRVNDVPPDIKPESLTKSDLRKKLFLAEMTDWPNHLSMPFGRIIKCIGPVGDVDSYTAAILVENGVEDVPFPADELNKLIKSFRKIAADKEPGRHDFRNDCVFTIDPPDAKDLDDAVSCSDLGDGIFRVGVHIADVSFFIADDSLLDLHARQRGTSVYLVNKVVSMLPHKLIEKCCSLDPGKDRRTLSVIFTMTDNGEILDTQFSRGLIRSRVKLSYKIAQDIIEDPAGVTAAAMCVKAEDGDAIRRTVLNLHVITQSLRQERFRKGGLRIDQPEFRYELDEKGLPIAMFAREHWASCQLIEELALLTNMVSASLINKRFPEIALLRRHPEPQQGPLNNMRKLCELEKMEMKIDSAKNIQTSTSIIAASRPDLLPVLGYLSAKPMKLAEYFCSGLESDTWHYALDVEEYTHMTSPIRRYPDIIVHRLLLAALGYTDQPTTTTTEMREIVEKCNEKKLAAGRCQEASSNLFFGLFLQRFGPLTEDGVVVAVYGASQSVDILVPRLAFVQRVFCAKVSRVKTVNHRIVGLKHVLDLCWGKDDNTLRLTVWSNVKVVLSVGSEDVRNIKVLGFGLTRADDYQLLTGATNLCTPASTEHSSKTELILWTL